ncbi:N-acetylmuramoyl-L-alanine amidase [Clostridium bowmanii]|uniref:N-acetylmuramoyl-L-alanine amidase n=1 Tax=Clostridium bowmanii TaxID=132925 RepID=UPI001C0C5BBC|nr:N-acetylmuramoyl-L-alanine amidase [Clostridium bowmanii]MBU3189406.1 N-acetylmuramoyl-L-alanine amidase [Clostridium bowmanii]MCA1074020.1 N-acetylmuramoyl-L-alanine amidase [Clostridium bowmanii]
MTKMRKVLLAFMVLFIIGGVLYRTTYVGKAYEKITQSIKANTENKNSNDKEEAVKDKVLENKTEDEKEDKTLTKEKTQVEVQEYKKVEKQPSKKIIVIDPGHASATSMEKEQQAPGSSIMKVKEPGGAQGINTKTPEYVVNMAVAVRLKTLLEEKGYTVVMTKTQNKQMLGNIARAIVGNKAKADLVIRIHADSNNDSSVEGASMLVPSDSKNTNAIYKASKIYGEIVLNNLINSIGMKNRGVVERDDMTGFNWSKVPVILVEMGFQSNVEEDKKLTTESYQNKISKALADGIHKALVE